MSLTGDHTLGRPVNAGAGVPPTRPGENEDGFDRSRDYFPGCTSFAGLTKFAPLVGPLTTRPHRSLADVVRAVAA